QPPLLGRSPEAEGLEIQLREVCDRAMDPLYNEGAALATHDRAIQRQMGAGVLEHREAETERSRHLPPPLRQQPPQVLEPAGEQGLLVGKVRIKGRPPDVCPIDD